VESHYRRRKLFIFWLAVAAGLALVALLAPSYAAAQGTAEQRVACEDEARWLCSNYIPDADAIKGCMLRNLDQLSPRCRAMFGPGRKRQGGHVRRRK
jgi:hypothetical protein